MEIRCKCEEYKITFSKNISEISTKYIKIYVVGYFRITWVGLYSARI